MLLKLNNMKNILKKVGKWIICVAIAFAAAIIVKLLGGSNFLCGGVMGIILVESQILFKLRN